MLMTAIRTAIPEYPKGRERFALASARIDRERRRRDVDVDVDLVAIALYDGPKHGHRYAASLRIRLHRIR